MRTARRLRGWSGRRAQAARCPPTGGSPGAARCTGSIGCMGGLGRKTKHSGAQSRVRHDRAQVGQNSTSVRYATQKISVHAWTNEEIAVADGVDHQAREARIVEDRLDDDHAAEQIRRLSAIALAIGPIAFGAHGATRRVRLAPFNVAISTRRAQLLDHRGARHAGHLRDHDRAWRQHRHHAYARRKSMQAFDRAAVRQQRGQPAATSPRTRARRPSRSGTPASRRATRAELITRSIADFRATAAGIPSSSAIGTDGA